MDSHEVRHNTREQIIEYATTALEIADELQLSVEDRRVLLPVLAGWVASKTRFDSPPAAMLARGIDLARLQGE